TEAKEKTMTARRAAMGLGVVLLAVLAAVALRYPQPGPPAVRTVALEGWPSAVAVDTRTAHAFIASSDVAHHTGRVSVLDTATGTIVRTVVVPVFPTAVAVSAAPRRAATGARVFVAGYSADGRGCVYVLDARAGRVFVASAGGVGVLDARRGVLLRTLALSAPPAAMDVDERRGRIFIGTTGPAPGMGLSSGTAHVSVLDASGGTVMTTVPLSA